MWSKMVRQYSGSTSPLWEEKMTPEDELRRPFPTRKFEEEPLSDHIIHHHLYRCHVYDFLDT